MSLTEKQRAYHLRKIRTRYERMDMDKNGYLSREDYQLMGEKLIENNNGITSEQAANVRNIVLTIADSFGLKPGVKIPLEDAAKNSSEKLLSMPPEKQIGMLTSTHDIWFDVIDANNDGFISMDEFIVYLRAIISDISDADVKRSFDAIDADKNGKISREELLAAAKDFLLGVEVTDVSETFMGPLL